MIDTSTTVSSSYQLNRVNFYQQICTASLDAASERCLKLRRALTAMGRDELMSKHVQLAQMWREAPVQLVGEYSRPTIDITTAASSNTAPSEFQEPKAIPLTALATFSRHIFTGDEAGLLRHWLSNGTCVATGGNLSDNYPSRINCLSVRANESHADVLTDFLVAAGGNQGILKLWRFDNATNLESSPPHSAECIQSLSPSVEDHYKLSGLTFSPGGVCRVRSVQWSPTLPQLLASAHSNGLVQLWDVEHGTPLNNGILSGLTHEATDLSFHPDGALLAVCDLGGTVRLWDLRLGKEIWHMPSHVSGRSSYPTQTSFSLTIPIHEQSSSKNNQMNLSKTSCPSSRPLTRPHYHGLLSLAFTPAGGDRLVVAGCDGLLSLWDLRQVYSKHKDDASGLLWRRAAHSDYISSVCFDSDIENHCLYSTSLDGSVAVWDAWSGQEWSRLGLSKPLRSISVLPRDNPRDKTTLVVIGHTEDWMRLEPNKPETVDTTGTDEKIPTTELETEEEDDNEDDEDLFAGMRQ